jgi:predicted ATPase
MGYLARREPVRVCEVYGELAALCRKHGIAQELQWATPLCGRALVEIGDVAHGLAMLSQGLEAHIATRSTLLRPYYFVLYAGSLLRAGKVGQADEALQEARRVAEATSQRAYDAEHRRLQAEVLRAQGKGPSAEECYQESLAIARAQGARWLELRGARGYASLLVDAGRPAEARQLLTICESFTEGRDSLDFVYADALLKTL